MLKSFKKYFKFTIAILAGFKHTLSDFIRSINNFRFFYQVGFYNTQNIFVDLTANIEKGSVLIVSKPEEENQKYIQVHKNSWVGRNVELQSYFNSKIIVNNNASIQDRCKLLGDVTIGQFTLLAPDVFISSGNHLYNQIPEYLIKEQDSTLMSTAEGFLSFNRPVTVEEDCWIGKGVMVKQGVYIGRGAVIGAGSLVSRNVEPYTVVAGVPAKIIKKRLFFDPPTFLASDKIQHLPYFYRGFNHLKSHRLLEPGSKGVVSGNTSIITIKKILWQEISITGRCFNKCTVEIWLDGVFTKKMEPAPGVFSAKISSINKSNNSKTDPLYLALPDFIKQHFVVSFRCYGGKSEANFAIKNIEVI